MTTKTTKETIKEKKIDTAFDYLAAFDAALPSNQFPLVQQWMKKEPLAFFKQLREQRPILVTPECTLVTRFDECS